MAERAAETATVTWSSTAIGAVMAAMFALGAAAALQEASEILSADGKRLVGEYNLGKKALAIGGYDPVAYFGENAEPVEGRNDLELEHRGLRYRFASEKNRDLFEKDPGKYEPLYGGWCAYAMATGDKVKIDPKAYLIEDGKLLLFYRKSGLFGTNDTRKPWRKNREKLRSAADAKWRDILEKARRATMKTRG